MYNLLNIGGYMKRIINDSSIWDLHIHSCKSPKSTGEFQKMEVDEYIKLLRKCQIR